MKYALLGAGGHARALMDILYDQRESICFLVGKDTKNFFKRFDHIKHLINDEDLLKHETAEIQFICGIGPRPFSLKRRELIEYYENNGFEFNGVISKTAILSPFCKISCCCQIMQFVVINSSSKIGKHTIINTGAIVEHDVSIGEHSFIGPGAILCGGVQVGNNVFIGVGAKIFPGLKIRNNAVISGGAIVVRDVDDGEVYK